MLSPSAFALSRQATLEHAEALKSRGFTVIPQAGVSDQTLHDAASESSAHLDSLLGSVTDLGLDALAQEYQFAEICHRHQGRWDFRVPESAACAAVWDDAEARVAPIIESMHTLPLHPDATGAAMSRRLAPRMMRRPKRLMTGAIVSRPGATAQAFHSDSDQVARKRHHMHIPASAMTRAACLLVAPAGAL